MNSKNPQQEQGTISIDGARFAPADGEWKYQGTVSPSSPRGTPPLPAELTYISIDGARGCRLELDEPPLIAWKSLDPDGNFVGFVCARNALEALQQMPERYSVYLGGPSPAEPGRLWWVDEWQTAVETGGAQ